MENKTQYSNEHKTQSLILMLDAEYVQHDEDLQMLGDLLTIFKGPQYTWEQFYKQYSIVEKAIDRLKEAHARGEVTTLTLSLVQFFEKE